MASTVKVAVAALYLAQVDHGRRSLDDTINGQPARSLMARMLIHSDNRATDILLERPWRTGPRSTAGCKHNGVTGLRVDRTIAQLLSNKRDLWDRRDSSTPMAMVDLLRRIYKAELIKPESRDYLLRPDGPVRNRQEPDEGAAALRAPLSSIRPGRLTASPTMSASSPCPTAAALRSRSSRAAAPTVRAPSPRPRGRSTTALSRSSPGRSSDAHRTIVLLHIVARGKIGRSPEAELVERYLKRIAWPTKVTELPDRGGNVPALSGERCHDRAR